MRWFIRGAANPEDCSVRRKRSFSCSTQLYFPIKSPGPTQPIGATLRRSHHRTGFTEADNPDLR